MKKYVDFNILKYILDLVKLDHFIKRETIRYLVLQKINIEISLNKITIIYRKLKLTWKKPKNIVLKMKII